MPNVTRRAFLHTTAAAASSFYVVDLLSAAGSAAAPLDNGALDRYVEQYMREMGAPGMTLALANRGGIVRIATYGFSDVRAKEPVRPDHLFHIGSISKSFVGIALLQLHEEGKLDLHKPVVDYLPWFRVDQPLGKITAHHLLTHSSGLPSSGPVFLADPAERHQQGFVPGAHYHYCNMGYELLGYLLWTLDKRPFADSIRERIFKPLGMTESEPTISTATRARQVNSYVTYHDERPYPRAGRLADAPAMYVEFGAGSIASTPRDMGRYMTALLNRGRGVLKPESFALMVTPHVKTGASPDAGYGYGLFTDKLDGHDIVRHTGGMVSFMSAMHVDLDEGVAAFASINAQQGYRPNPVSVYAVKLMRGKEVAPPPPNPPVKIENASDFAGTYTSPDGKKLLFVAEGERLFLVHGEQRLPVEIASSGSIVRHPDFERFAFTFGRAEGEKPPVIEVAHGADWYVNERYTGPREFAAPAEWDAYAGHYRNENPWFGSLRVVKRKGKLFLDGTPLVHVRGARFRLGDPPHNPEWIEFRDVVNGKAMHAKLSGEDLWRVFA